MTPWPSEPDEMLRSNRDTVARLTRVPVAGLPFVSCAEPKPLAAAAAALPLARWLGL